MNRPTTLLGFALGLGLLGGCDLEEGFSFARDPHNDGIVVGGIIPYMPSPTYTPEDNVWLMGENTTMSPGGVSTSVALVLNGTAHEP
jgi:hypothetical protein